jgi:hypothetical protein
MKTSNNYISVETAKTLINNGAKFHQGFLRYNVKRTNYDLFQIITNTKTFLLNKKNASLIKDWLKTHKK